MKQITNFQFHHNSSKTLVFVLPGARGSCYSSSQTCVYNFFVNKGISCISTNYAHQDKGDKFYMADDFHREKDNLYIQIQGFWEKINTIYDYEEVIIIGNSLGAVLFNHLIEIFGPKIKHFFILGYLTGYIKPENITGPTTIIQGQHDKYGNIQKVKEDVGENNMVNFFEIQNADHSYFDISNPSIRKNQEVYNIIFNIVNSLEKDKI